MNEAKFSEFSFSEPQSWSLSLSTPELMEKVKETAFSTAQREEGKDFCYYFQKTIQVEDAADTEYLCMVYSLDQPDTLNSASVYEMELREHEHLFLHRCGVIREGEYIDKLADATCNVFDSENSSERGIINKMRKVNITFKDLRLNDVLLIETSIQSQYTEKHFIRREFYRNLYVTVGVYWPYAYYQYKLVNNSTKNIAYQKHFFKDSKSENFDEPKQILAPGESFSFIQENYLNEVDTNREFFPYIDFATDKDWESLANFIYPIYDEIIKKQPLAEFAPDLKAELDAIEDQELKIQYAIEYVQNSIKYIYNEQEMDGHKPQEPSLTYQNKQGDCKAKTVLLKVILDYLNIDSTIVLVNYNADFFLKHYLPSLFCFNHVIVKIAHKGKEYFVDATYTDQYGTLENRSFLFFNHYLPIAANQTLKVNPPFHFPKLYSERKDSLQVKDNVGILECEYLVRYNQANEVRSMFKNTNKRQLIDNISNYFFRVLCLANYREETDIRKVITEVVYEITRDDKVLNEVVVHIRATILDPYSINEKKQRFLELWDRTLVNSDAIEFNHKEATLSHNRTSERREIFLSTDQEIDTKEKYTIQECSINNPYFTYFTKKEITKHSGKITYEYNPLTNVEVPLPDIEQLRKDSQTMADSNYGIGIDIIEPGFFNKLKRLF